MAKQDRSESNDLSAVQLVTVHALSRAWTVTSENPIPNRLRDGIFVVVLGFFAKCREKHLAFQVGLNCNYNSGLVNV